MRCKVPAEEKTEEVAEEKVEEKVEDAAPEKVEASVTVEHPVAAVAAVAAVVKAGSGEKPAARICRVVKAQGQSYGFSIKMDKSTNMEVIDKVSIGGPAHAGGLVNGDRVWWTSTC